MIVFFNDSGFLTFTGKFYYLWRKEDGKIIILYLGNNKSGFKSFLDNIRKVYRGRQKITFIHKKSRDIEKAIGDYLDGKISKINFRVEFLIGTDFQKNVWEKLISIPRGETISYRKLSDIAGYKKAWRAVGSALRNNPVMLVVPCHRVIKSDGSRGEFRGGSKLKSFLLDLEKS